MSLNKFTSWIGLVFLLFLVGCQQQEVTNREENRASDKYITVMDNPEKTTYEKSVVDSIVRLDDVRGMDWLSEEKIIIDRENHNYLPEKAEGSEWYPHNLYTYSLLTNVQTPLHPANENQGYAQVSPDRTKVFYKTYSLQSNTGKGLTYDITTGKATAFTDTDAMDIQNGRWVDNDSIVYATIDGTIYTADAGNSSPRKLLDSANPFTSNIAYMNDHLFFTSLKGALMTSTLEGEPDILPISNVVWMVPSPDEQRLAIVRKVKSGAMELLITDLQGTILQAIAQDSQIYGTSWSPDGNKLAYAAITPNGTVRGIYVADASTGIPSALSVDIKFIADPLNWSPTGNRLMVSATQPDEQQSRNRFMTYLVRVS
ncbi:hypothetical protein [Cohnella sp. WQ 127256]|uniref:hypothetical protein n=1 Tax=Cohnella sp. WQ 127256 TaxID=2938790 RepID=UPI002117EFCB|nr:hypothetical protein [Cohnella sp. WQ 127256]